MSDALAVVLPFVSVLLGGAITHLVNVRERRRGKVEDVFHAAIEPWPWRWRVTTSSRS